MNSKLLNIFEAIIAEIIKIQSATKKKMLNNYKGFFLKERLKRDLVEMIMKK